MGLDLKDKETWWYVSDENMMCSHYMYNIDYGYNTEDKLWSQGVHDCVEITYEAYQTYKYEPFIDGIKSCWKKIETNNGYYYKPQRYPIAYESMKDMSRDHVMYSICAFLESGMSQKDIWEYAGKVKLGKKRGLTMNTELWLWLRLVSGKKIGWLYYPLMLRNSFIYLLGNKLIDKISGFGEEEHPDRFKPLLIAEKPKIVNMLAKSYILPTYALKLILEQLNRIPQNWWTKQIRKNINKLVPKYNFVLRKLAGMEISDGDKEIIRNHKSNTADRWSMTMNRWTNDRIIYNIDEKWPERKFLIANNLQKDYAMKIILGE